MNLPIHIFDSLIGLKRQSTDLTSYNIKTSTIFLRVWPNSPKIENRVYNRYRYRVNGSTHVFLPNFSFTFFSLLKTWSIAQGFQFSLIHTLVHYKAVVRRHKRKHSGQSRETKVFVYPFADLMMDVLFYEFAELSLSNLPEIAITCLPLP